MGDAPDMSGYVSTRVYEGKRLLSREEAEKRLAIRREERAAAITRARQSIRAKKPSDAQETP